MKFTLTKRETQIMQVLWEAKSALSSKEIAKSSESLSQNTVQSVLRKLLESGYVETTGVGYSGTVLTRKYSPKISEEEFLNSIISSGALKNILANYISGPANSTDLDKLENLISEKRRSLRR